MTAVPEYWKKMSFAGVGAGTSRRLDKWESKEGRSSVEVSAGWYQLMLEKGERGFM